MPSATTTVQDEPLHVAIIGAGITGLNLALGLQARNVSFTIYERAPGFREIGAGIGFSPNAERALGSLNAEALAAFKRVANPNGEDYFQWIDGYDSAELIFKLHVGKDGFMGCRRCDILEEWAKLVPDDAVRFGKEIDTVLEPDSEDGKLTLYFKDGTTASADAVIGCDGIRSRVRQLIHPGPKTKGQKLPPWAHPHYTRKFCYRALVPMAHAVEAIGTYRASTRFMYNGPGAHVITYPVGNNSVLNILAVISDPNPSWSAAAGGGMKHTGPGSRAEAEAAFKDWHPAVRSIVGLFPDQMDKWAIFDMAEHPAPGYVKGRVCVAGDAAHATGPHLGAGGGMGIEDALVLAGLLAEVKERVGVEGEGRGMLVAAALAVYDDVRYERTQGVVQSTRAACDLFHWRDPQVGRDPEKFGREITERFHRIWEYDVDDMVDSALQQLDERVR
ncbi:Salicylate hydroxylase [Madurella fahalii]|uniref:Salicylate hydroxylase n=1 Tax=Madurella fahalii TaxID=1157608 RepID=A0ABQ0GKW9_9PEZI